MARDYFKKQGIHFDKAFSSTQERACDTLEIITDYQMPYTRLKDLREKCYGIFEGSDEFLLPWNYNNPNVDPTMEKDEDVVGRMYRTVVEILKMVRLLWLWVTAIFWQNLCATLLRIRILVALAMLQS